MSSFQVSVTGRDNRRADMDWMRVTAFALLVPFHAAVLFEPQPIPQMASPTSSPALAAFDAFLHLFRLALLFLVSGMGVRFALKRRSSREYLRDRSVRLLLPLLFGVLVLVPPMVYLEALYNERFVGNLWEFYGLYWCSGIYPEGFVSWHHFWFIAYLYLFCLITRKWFFQLLHSPSIRFRRWVMLAKSSSNLYAFALILLVVEIVLRPVFPGFRNLVADWASFAHWLLFFIAGFVFALNPDLLLRVRALRHRSLVLACCSTLGLFLQFYSVEKWTFVVATEITAKNAVYFILFSAFRVFSTWCWVLTCVGYSVKYLTQDSRLLRELNRAVFPMYCLHLPFLLFWAYHVLPTGLSVSGKFLCVVIGTYASLAAAYPLVRALPPWAGALIGWRSPSALSSRNVRSGRFPPVSGRQS
ncbi:MAG: acyltransferase family protein [Pseudomonadota bacterium]